MVLSSCSGFFSDLFRENPCQHPVVVLRGSALWEIRALVDFMYRGEVNVQQNRLAEFLAAAEEFRVLYTFKLQFNCQIIIINC